MSNKIKKRPKYVQDLVDEVNDLFRQQGIKDISENNLFWFTLNYLSKRKMYRGYNFYINKYDAKKDKYVPILAGTADPSKYDYIQIW